MGHLFEPLLKCVRKEKSVVNIPKVSCSYPSLLLTSDGLVVGPLLGYCVVGFTVGKTVKGANAKLCNQKFIENHNGWLHLA